MLQGINYTWSFLIRSHCWKMLSLKSGAINKWHTVHLLADRHFSYMSLPLLSATYIAKNSCEVKWLISHCLAPSLNSCDNFYCGATSKVKHAPHTPPPTIDELWAKTAADVAIINPDLLTCVWDELLHKCDNVHIIRGQHRTSVELEDALGKIIFSFQHNTLHFTFWAILISEIWRLKKYDNSKRPCVSMLILRFSWLGLQRLHLRCDWYKFTDILEEYAASIYSVKE